MVAVVCLLHSRINQQGELSSQRLGKYFTLGSQSLRDKICAMSQRKVTPQSFNSYSIQVLKRGVHVKLERRKKPTVKKLFICKSQIEQKFIFKKMCISNSLTLLLMNAPSNVASR